MGAEERSELVLNMIAAAFMAGANWQMAQVEPLAAGGLGRMTRKHLRRAATLAREVIGETASPN